MMYREVLIRLLSLFLFTGSSQGQVQVRLFAQQNPGSAVFTVTGGKYELDLFDNKPVFLTKDDPVFLAFSGGRLVVKTRQSRGFLCDSLIIKGLTGNDGFSLRISGAVALKQFYTGSLRCLSDMGKLVLVNISDVEQYIAGVVKAEGGPGKNIEYLKSQALLVRSYMYKYFNRHFLDRYNLCDNTHCQAFFGITTDSMIIRAALETTGLVVLSHDSILINAAFHSNCGGETSVSENVWLSGHSYLKKVTDPYCTSSRNAKWNKTIPLTEWKEYLAGSGFKGTVSDPAGFNFSQITRLPDYKVGTFSLPFTRIRSDLGLRSAFFSVQADKDSVYLKGRGYGHGVGLCQEGAMTMASKGFNFRQIIEFYFSEVIITSVKNIKKEINNF